MFIIMSNILQNCYLKNLDKEKMRPYTFFTAWGLAFPLGNGLSSGRRNMLPVTYA